MAKLYGDLDHAHGFYEGNSRTLREFTRELAAAAGYSLNWTPTGVDAQKRNALYIARDVAVLERAYPGLTEERAMKTQSRAEYEAWWHLEKLRERQGGKTLETIIGPGLRREAQFAPDGPAKATETSLRVAGAVVTSLLKVVSALVDFFVGSPPPRRLTAAEALKDREAERAYSLQKAADRARDTALDRMAADIKAGRNLRMEDVRALRRDDLENIKARGDAHLLDMIRDREREEARKKRERGRER